MTRQCRKGAGLGPELDKAGPAPPRLESGRSLILNGHIDLAPEGPHAINGFPADGYELEAAREAARV